MVNDSAALVQEVTIKDKTLIDKVRLIDEMPEQEKNMFLQVIDLALSKKKIKDLVQQIG